jgi:hypothetical protein
MFWAMAGCVVPASLVALAAPAASGAETSFQDAAGDSGGVPDITRVVVSDAAGRLSFKVWCPLASGHELDIRLDTDKARGKAIVVRLRVTLGGRTTTRQASIRIA